MTRFSGSAESRRWAREVEGRIRDLERRAESPRQAALLAAAEIRASAAGFMRVDDLRFPIDAIDGVRVTEDLGEVLGPPGATFGVLLGVRVESSGEGANIYGGVNTGGSHSGALANASGYIAFNETVWEGGSVHLIGEVDLSDYEDSVVDLFVTIGWGGSVA